MFELFQYMMLKFEIISMDTEVIIKQNKIFLLFFWTTMYNSIYLFLLEFLSFECFVFVLFLLSQLKYHISLFIELSIFIFVIFPIKCILLFSATRLLLFFFFPFLFL